MHLDPPTAPCSGLQDRLDMNVVGLAFVSNGPAPVHGEAIIRDPNSTLKMSLTIHLRSSFLQ